MNIIRASLAPIPKPREKKSVMRWVLAFSIVLTTVLAALLFFGQIPNVKEIRENAAPQVLLPLAKQRSSVILPGMRLQDTTQNELQDSMLVSFQDSILVLSHQLSTLTLELAELKSQTYEIQEAAEESFCMVVELRDSSGWALEMIQEEMQMELIKRDSIEGRLQRKIGQLECEVETLKRSV